MIQVIVAICCSLFCAQLAAHPAQEQKNYGESLWTCPGCGLKYPHKHKYCSNSECPRFRQKK